MVNVPVRLPLEVGAKTTLIVHLAPAGTEAPHESVCVKLGPTAILLMVSGAAPALVSVIVCGALVVPTGCLANVRVKGERAAAGPVSP